MHSAYLRFPGLLFRFVRFQILFLAYDYDIFVLSYHETNRSYSSNNMERHDFYLFERIDLYSR